MAGSPSPQSHQLSVVPQLGAGTREHLSPRCWSVVQLDPRLQSCATTTAAASSLVQWSVMSRDTVLLRSSLTYGSHSLSAS